MRKTIINSINEKIESYEEEKERYTLEIQRKQELLQKILLENERKYQEKQKEIYNPDKLFEKPNTMKIENEAQNNKTANMQLIEVQNESKLRLIFEKIISWIKNLKK